MLITEAIRSTTVLPVPADYGYRIHDLRPNEYVAIEFGFDRPIRGTTFRSYVGSSSSPGGYTNVLFNSVTGFEIGRSTFTCSGVIGTPQNNTFNFNEGANDVLVGVHSPVRFALQNIWLLDVTTR